MEVSQTQLAVMIVVVAAAIGIKRGWGREVVTCAVVLGTLMFLQLGGLGTLGGAFSNAFASLSGPGSANCTVRGPAAAATTSDQPQLLSHLIFAGMVWLGYSVGRQHGGAAVTLGHRFWGLIVGAITGGAIAYYLLNVAFPEGITLLQGLNAINFVSSLALLLGIGLIGVLAVFLYSFRSGKGH
jgi:hypothetical protein